MDASGAGARATWKTEGRMPMMCGACHATMPLRLKDALLNWEWRALDLHEKTCVAAERRSALSDDHFPR